MLRHVSPPWQHSGERETLGAGVPGNCKSNDFNDFIHARQWPGLSNRTRSPIQQRAGSNSEIRLTEPQTGRQKEGPLADGMGVRTGTRLGSRLRRAGTSGVSRSLQSVTPPRSRTPTWKRHTEPPIPLKIPFRSCWPPVSSPACAQNNRITACTFHLQQV